MAVKQDWLVLKQGKWSESEIDFLKKNYSKLGCKECARRLGRGYNSIINHAQRLGVRKFKIFSNKEKLLSLVSCRELEKHYYTMDRASSEMPEKYSAMLGEPVSWYTIMEVLRNCGIKPKKGYEYRINHINLSREAIEFIEGELLGDGCITRPNTVSALYNHRTPRLDYLRWLKLNFERFGLKGKIYEYRCIKTGLDQTGDKEYITYNYISNRYAELLTLRNQWYPQNKKKVPRYLTLTPLRLRQWYIGDGHKDRNRISFHTQGFEESDVEFLVFQLMRLGFSAKKMHRKESSGFYIRLLTRDSKKFFDYIGPCPEEIKDVYGYKWPD